MNTVKAPLIHEPNPIKTHTKMHERLMLQIKALEKGIMMSARDDDYNMKNLIGCSISCPSISSPSSPCINDYNEDTGIKEVDYDAININLEVEEEISVLGSCCSDDDDGDEFFLRTPQEAQQQHDPNAFICNDLKRKRSVITGYPSFRLESTPLNEIPFECKNTTRFAFLNAKGHSSRGDENKMMEFL